MLDLEHGFVRENLSHEFGVKSNLIVRSSVGSDLIEELAEIVSDGKINENLLVESSVVISVNGLCVLELGEITERVSVAHEILNLTVRFESLDDVNDVLDLISVEHTSDELVQGVGGLTDEILELSHQLLFHVHSEELDIESIVTLSLEDSTTVVGILHDHLEFSHVVVSLKTSVNFLLEESLTQGADLSLSYGVVHVGVQHLANTKLEHYFV